MEKTALSVIFPVKGRDDYTKRWLNAVNQQSWPYPIFIADGNPSDALKSFINSSACHRLDINYRHYQDGPGYTGYFNRVLDVLERIETPLVLIAANDDFYNFTAIEQAVNFLLIHQDYSVCSGDVVHFSVVPEWDAFQRGDFIKGKTITRHLNPNYTTSIESSNIFKRLHQHANAYAHTFYGVHRREDLIKNYHLLIQAQIEDVFVMEHFFTFADIIAGKIKRLNIPYMARQRNSKASGKADLYRYGPLQYRYHCGQLWQKDYQSFLKILGPILANKTTKDEAYTKNILQKCYQDLLKVNNPQKDKYNNRFKRLVRRLKLALRTQHIMHFFKTFISHHSRGYWRQLKERSSCGCAFCQEVKQMVE